MRRFVFPIIHVAFLLLALSLQCCTKGIPEDMSVDEVPGFIECSVTEIGSTSVKLVAWVDKSSLVRGCGFGGYAYETADSLDEVSVPLTADGVFMHEYTGLAPSTLYVCYAYVTNGWGKRVRFQLFFVTKEAENLQ